MPLHLVIHSAVLQLRQQLEAPAFSLSTGVLTRLC
jgi:hypothetical protein